MKKLLKFFITTLTITVSMHCAAITKQFDTSTLPVLFYANQESYLAQTPWFNFAYQQRKIQLQTCKEEACVQRLQFLELQEGDQSHQHNNGSAFLGNADKTHTSNTYSKLRLGQSNHNTLHVSGNQRRILFLLKSMKEALHFNLNLKTNRTLSPQKSTSAYSLI
nr:hypothetical protein [Ningiella sp. W23]